MDPIEEAGFANVRDKTWKASVDECAEHLTIKEARRFNKMQPLMAMKSMCLWPLANSAARSPEEDEAWLTSSDRILIIFTSAPITSGERLV